MLTKDGKRADQLIFLEQRDRDEGASAGEFDNKTGYAPIDVAPQFIVTLPDGGGYTDGGALDGGTFHPLEVRYAPLSLPAGKAQDLVMLGDDGFVLRQRTGNFVRVTDPTVDLPALSHLARPTLRHDVTGSIWAFTRQDLEDSAWHALSTWRLDRGANASMSRVWNDCTPCKGGRLLAFVPVLNGAPAGS